MSTFSPIIAKDLEKMVHQLVLHLLTCNKEHMHVARFYLSTLRALYMSYSSM